jgi:hypothetical protein
MEEYAPGIFGEVRYSASERGYLVELSDAAGNKLGKTGFWTSEAKAREAARKLAAKMAKG